VIRSLFIFLLLQIETFASAKDWIVLTLVTVVGALLGGAWMDVKGQIRALSIRLDAKIEEDKTGYERLTRLEERVAAILGGRRVFDDDTRDRTIEGRDRSVSK
jgi:hypothetical protein